MQALEEEGSLVQPYRAEPLDGNLRRISAPLFILSAYVLDTELGELRTMGIGDLDVDHLVVATTHRKQPMKKLKNDRKEIRYRLSSAVSLRRLTSHRLAA